MIYTDENKEHSIVARVVECTCFWMHMFLNARVFECTWCMRWNFIVDSLVWTESGKMKRYVWRYKSKRNVAYMMVKCLYVYVYVCVRVCVCVWGCVCVFVCVCLCVGLCVRVGVFVCVYLSECLSLLCNKFVLSSKFLKQTINFSHFKFHISYSRFVCRLRWQNASNFLVFSEIIGMSFICQWYFFLCCICKGRYV